MSKRRALGGKAQSTMWLLLLLIPAFMIMPAQTIAQPTGDFDVYVDCDNFPALGETIDVPITFKNSSDFTSGGFELLIRYDNSGLIFNGVTEGQYLVDCNWDSFFYQEISPGFLSIYAIANTDGIGLDCYLENGVGELARISFTVMDDSALICQSLPVEFYWQECTHNLFSDETGQNVLGSDSVWDPDDFVYTGGETLGTTQGAPDECFQGSPNPIQRFIDFHSGNVSIDCGPIPPMPGDVNVNEIPFEIADYVIFTNWFIYGDSIFYVDFERQVAHTDCNGDGLVLTARDLIYLLLVIEGDTIPPSGKSSDDPINMAYIVQDTLNKTIRIIHSDSLSAAFFIFNDQIVPAYNGPMYFDYGYDNQDTRALIHPNLSTQTYNFMPGEELSYTGDGLLTYVDLADYNGSFIPSTILYSAGGLICGDVNGDNQVNVSDAVYMISWIFVGGPPPQPLIVADVNCDNQANISDAVYIINWIFNSSDDPCTNCPLQ